jgi:class 3 adenylate cyclase/tetratricopeptide (TPR) repeat protein
MFCDIVGATMMSERIDPEDMRELLAIYHHTCAEVVRRFDGCLAALLGDGVVVYFGYPMAHEDDAVRAVRCGLEIQAAIQERARGAVQPFEVRVGVHRGRVVVGALGGGSGIQTMAIGETPNLAARLQAEAKPGEVVVSDTLWRLVQWTFRSESLGVRSLKGIQRPVEIHRILEYLPVASPKAVASYFVGRSQELGSIRARWQRVLEGHSQVVLLSGEPGIGKTRLIQRMVTEFDVDSITVMEAHCTPFTTDTPFHPLAALMRSRLALEGLNSSRQLEQLARRLGELGLPRQEALPLLAMFLSIEVDPDQWPRLADMSPVRRRQRTIDLLCEALLGIAAAAPVLLIIEDLHWADPSTIDLLHQQIALQQNTRVLMLLSARPEFRPPWAAAENVSEIMLDALDGTEAESFIRIVAADKPMPPEVVRQIRLRSAGNPLFLEEITRSVMESTSLVERDKTWELVGPLSTDVVPASMEAALMARIDHLGAARPLLQLGATLGREFSIDLLLAVASMEEATVERHLNRMVDEGFLHLIGGTPPVYTFKHALVQDAAYESLLRSTRQEHHARIAEVMAEQFPELARSRSELLAHHLSGAGRYAEAATHWQAAGEAAAERSAVNEAVEHLRRGLADLEQLPQAAERWHSELSLHTALAPVQMAVHGWASAFVERTCLRAIELAGHLGADQRRFAPLWGLWSNQFVAGRLREAMQSANQVLELAADSGVRMYAVTARHATSYTRYYRGEYEQALKEAEIGLDLNSFEQDREIANLFQLSSAVATMTAKGCSLWMLGHQKEGIAVMDQMLKWARDLNHPPSIAAALAFIMHFCFYDRDWHRVLAFAEELLDLSSAEGYALWRADAGMFRAKAILELRIDGADLSDVLEWYALFQQTGSDVICSTTTCINTEELHRVGRSEEALRQSGIGEKRAEEGHVGVMVPEIIRTRGDILSDLGRSQEADEAYDLAVQSARSQGALSLELRALTSLLAHRLGHGGARERLPELRQALERMETAAGRPDPMKAHALLAKAAP